MRVVVWALGRWAQSLEDTVIFSVDYRLAPEFPFPCGLEDCWQVYQWIVNEYAPSNQSPLIGFHLFWLRPFIVHCVSLLFFFGSCLNKKIMELRKSFSQETQLAAVCFWAWLIGWFMTMTSSLTAWRLITQLWEAGKCSSPQATSSASKILFSLWTSWRESWWATWKAQRTQRTITWIPFTPQTRFWRNSRQPRSSLGIGTSFTMTQSDSFKESRIRSFPLISLVFIVLVLWTALWSWSCSPISIMASWTGDQHSPSTMRFWESPWRISEGFWMARANWIILGKLKETRICSI